MTRVALLRHYPTDWNGEHRLQGQVDRPLTSAAEDALRALRLPDDLAAVRVISSTLHRAIQTARLLGREPSTDPRLMEVAWGDWEGCRAEDLQADPSSGFMPTGEMPWDMRPPGGESRKDAWARTRPALAEIADDPAPALIVTHKALMRVILQIAHDHQSAPEIKRGRLYPLTLREDGRPVAPGPVMRLVAREREAQK
ncbi:MAG: histidine phosphatase family protein [Pseudomonadota bacterium]